MDTSPAEDLPDAEADFELGWADIAQGRVPSLAVGEHLWWVGHERCPMIPALSVAKELPTIAVSRQLPVRLIEQMMPWV